MNVSPRAQSLFRTYYWFTRISSLIFGAGFLVFGIFLLLLFGKYYFEINLEGSMKLAKLIAEKHYTEYIFQFTEQDKSLLSTQELLLLKKEKAIQNIKESLVNLTPGLVVVNIEYTYKRPELYKAQLFSFPPLEIKLQIGFSKSYVLKWFFYKALYIFLFIAGFMLFVWYYQINFLMRFKKSLDQLIHELNKGGKISPLGYIEIDALIDAVNRAIESEREIVKTIAAQEKLVALGTFAGGYAHEFNNLLQIMSMNLELIHRYLEENKREPIFLLLEKINRTILKGQNLAQKLLYLTKKTETETTDLAELISHLEDTFRIFVPREISFKIIKETEEKCLVPLSEESVKEIIVNLLKNAVDAVVEKKTQNNEFKGEIEIRIKKEENKCLLEISDNGIGMPEEVKRRLFEPFFTTKGIGKGTGLGLYLIYNLVKNADGEIKVESKEGEGTRFQIILPISSLPSHELDSSSFRREQKKVKYRKILVVDDEEDISETLADFLGSMGLEVKTARNGATAYELIKSEDFDLALVDMYMPEKGGDWLISQIDKLGKKDLKIVIMTGYAGEMEETIKQAFSQGKILDIIRKPFSLSDIVKIVYGE